jgi:hypothetical protein
MAKGSRRRSRSSSKTYKRLRKHANELPEVPVAPVVTYTVDELPPDSALRRRPPSTDPEAADRP